MSFAPREWVSTAQNENFRIASEILDHCKNSRIFAILGQLGAGKTTLVQAICKVLGSDDDVKSPTFALVHEYARTDGKIFHFDLYRMEDLEEAYGIGFEEYVDSNEYCFIEWPEMVEPLLPEDTVVIRIKVAEDGSRKIVLDRQD